MTAQPSTLRAAGAWLCLLALTSAFLAACGVDAPVANERRDQVRAADPREIVARVNGVPITVGELRQQLAGQQGVTAREALKQLISFELLAQEAHRRGLGARPEVSRMQSRAAANLLIRRTFGDTFTTKTIPHHLVKKAYKLNQDRYIHEEMVVLDNLVVWFPPDKAKRTPQVMRQAKRLAARALARLRARGVKRYAELQAVAEEIRSRPLPGGLRVSTERIQTTWLPGTREPMSRAAFALKPGELSSVVETIYAYYVIWLEAKLPAKSVSLADAEAEIRQRIFGEARKIAFEELLTSLERQHSVRYFYDALKPAQKQ